MIINRFKKVFNNEIAMIDEITSAMTVAVLMMLITCFVIFTTGKFTKDATEEAKVTMENTKKAFVSTNITSGQNSLPNEQINTASKVEKKVDNNEVIKDKQESKPVVKEEQKAVAVEEKDNSNGVGNFFQQFFVEFLAGGTLSIIGFVIGKISRKNKTKLDMRKI